MSGRHMGTRKRSLKNPADCAQSRTASHWCDLTLIEASWDFSMRRYGRCRCADTRAWSEPFLHILNFLCGRTPVIGWWTGLHSSPSCRPGYQFRNDRTERFFQEFFLINYSRNRLFWPVKWTVGWRYPHTAGVLLLRARATMCTNLS